LNQAKIATGIDLSDFDVCSDTCEYYKDNSCGVSQDESIFLSKEKFGWRLNLKINFDEPVSSKSENTYYCSLIQLIHPTYSDLWISKGLKKDKETDIYLLFFEGKHKDTYKSFETLNKFIKEKFHYKGRLLTDNDFSITGENDVQN